MTNQIPETDLKALRKKLGLTQTEFAKKIFHQSRNVAKLGKWKVFPDKYVNYSF